MMKFGLYLEIGVNQLVDLTTGEIVAETVDTIQEYLQKYENNYTLEII